MTLSLPVELPLDSATEQSCSTKGQDLKEVLALSLVSCEMFSVPVPAEQNGVS